MGRYNTLLQSCVRSFRLDVALSLYQEIVQHPKLTADVETYNALIRKRPCMTEIYLHFRCAQWY